jgi:hypothetical protein
MRASTYSDGIGCQIPGYGPNATADFAVLAWSANVGKTFSQALAVWNNGSPRPNPGVTGFPFFMGLSTVANDVILGPAGGPYDNVWGPASSGQIQGMVLDPYPVVPEPGSLALLGLGALFFFRRLN